MLALKKVTLNNNEVKPGTVPSKNKTSSNVHRRGLSSISLERSNTARMNHIINVNTSRFTHQSHKQFSFVDSLDNGSNVTSTYDRKKMQELRKELLLIMRFFCLDK